MTLCDTCKKRPTVAGKCADLCRVCLREVADE